MTFQSPSLPGPVTGHLSPLEAQALELDDPRPHPPEAALVQVGQALMTELLDLLGDTALEDFQIVLCEALIGAFHSASQRIDREADRSRDEVRRLLRDFDASEVADADLQAATRKTRAADVAVMAADLVRDAALVKLQMVGLKPEHATRMPADLSGGMVKRVALARALIMDPPFLLLDEPTAGLDPSSSDDFCALVRELRAALGLTVIMVTHDLDTLFALSTRVAVLADKKVIVTGPPHEVAHFKHPFIEHFFMGERGQRAMAPLQPPAPAATPNAAAPSKET